MATNTSALKTFAQQTRAKLVALITTKMQYVLNSDTAELRGYESQISKLREEISKKTEKIVIEEIAYTWFNRVMALRFMDANGYTSPKVITPADGQLRPEILQDAMAGTIDEELNLSQEDLLLPEEKLYRKLLVAVCNNQMSTPMPFLFEHISDYTELLLPDDLLSEQSFITDIRKGMTDEDCQNVELMGWLYQFYITDRKAEAEIKKNKKGGLRSDEQAAATQLFTPHWVVRYMVENSLGRIWMTLHPESHLIDNMPYYIAPLEGQSDTIPEDIHSVRDIRFIDPCMGSGHVLVYAFDLFCKMYAEEGEMDKDIPALILKNNLFGIDIDHRCYQLASFALTMKARDYYSRYLRHTVIPNVIALEPIEHDVIASAGNWQSKSLIWQFENVDTIGSLLKIDFNEYSNIHVENGLFGARQKVLKTQAGFLSKSYHCVVTNPPYLGKGFCDELKNYIWKVYPNSKADTMATFMERTLEMCSPNGKMAMINMHSWMFISSFEELRHYLLENYRIDNMLHLGTRAFDEIGGEVVQSTTFVCSKQKPAKGDYFRLVDGKNSTEKEKLFLESLKNKEASNIHFSDVAQNNFKKIPGSPIGYWVSDNFLKCFENKQPIDKKYKCREGIHTADNNRFLRLWYEVSYEKLVKNATSYEDIDNQGRWVPYNKGGSFRKWFGNNEYVIGFDNVYRENMAKMKGHVRPSQGLYFLEGGTWSSISTGGISVRYYPAGFLFDAGGQIAVGDNIVSLIAYLNSSLFDSIAKITMPTINYKCGVIKTLPNLIINNSDIKELASKNIQISQEDWDSHETSWNFKTNELLRLALGLSSSHFETSYMYSNNVNISLESVVTKYKEYWESKFQKLHSNEEDINRQFLETYGLQNEVSSKVPLNLITILQKGEISVTDENIEWHEDTIIKQFISYLVGCLMGRFSIDKPGLFIASQKQKVHDQDLNHQTISVDDDGIIPIILEEDFFADDMTQRIESAIKTLFGEQYFIENMRFIKTVLGQDLRSYLYKNFYSDHQSMYSVKGAKRPIYWLFSSQMGDKKKKGHFKALVYMHRIEEDTLSKLHADYVHPYLNKISHQLVEAEDNATRDDLTQVQHNKALKIADELKEKVREVKAFEQQLVEMASHRLTIDLDDGVKANYPKFYPLVEPIKGLDAKEEQE